MRLLLDVTENIGRSSQNFVHVTRALIPGINSCYFRDLHFFRFGGRHHPGAAWKTTNDRRISLENLQS